MAGGREPLCGGGRVRSEPDRGGGARSHGAVHLNRLVSAAWFHLHKQTRTSAHPPYLDRAGRTRCPLWSCMSAGRPSLGDTWGGETPHSSRSLCPGPRHVGGAVTNRWALRLTPSGRPCIPRTGAPCAVIGHPTGARGHGEPRSLPAPASPRRPPSSQRTGMSLPRGLACRPRPWERARVLL